MAPKRKRSGETSRPEDGAAAGGANGHPPSREEEEKEEAAGESTESSTVVPKGPISSSSSSSTAGDGADQEDSKWKAFVSTRQGEIQEVLLDAMVGFWDTATLIQKKAVGRQWKRKCALAIQAKLVGGKPKAFESNAELRSTVQKYCGSADRPPDPLEVEGIARTYGYPIGKWDVSRMVDLNSVFCRRFAFNEDIAGWDTGNVTNMACLFLEARSFNQPIGNWNTSKVRNMHLLFRDAHRFDQDITHWDTGTVTDMYCMFLNARSFNQNVGRGWNLQSLQDSSLMFYGATSFAHQEAWDAAVAAAAKEKKKKAEN